MNSAIYLRARDGTAARIHTHTSTRAHTHLPTYLVADSLTFSRIPEREGERERERDARGRVSTVQTSSHDGPCESPHVSRPRSLSPVLFQREALCSGASNFQPPFLVAQLRARVFDLGAAGGSAQKIPRSSARVEPQARARHPAPTTRIQSVLLP